MLKGVEINPGALCNNRCVFCMSGVQRDSAPRGRAAWAPESRLRAQLLRFRAKGARSVGFTGGEPTAYPHLLGSAAYAKRLGYERIAVCTNGVRLAHRSFAEKLAEAGVTRVTLSIHSHLARVEEALTGVPGVHAKKLRALANLTALKKAGLFRDNVSLNPVLCRPNMRGLRNYARFFKRRGVDDIRFNFIWPQAKARNAPALVPRFQEAVPHMLALILENEKSLGMRVSFGGVPFCVLPRSASKRTSLLRKYFDESGDLGRETAAFRASPGGFEDVDWFERDRGDYKIHPPACRGCRYRRSCQGVFESYLSLYGAKEVGALR